MNAMSIEMTDWMLAPVTAPRPLFAIADVHGRADLLEAMHGSIAATIQADRLERALLVRLGDLIDRGPNSMGALATAAAGLGMPEVTEYDLAGNHEQFLLKILEVGDSILLGLLLLWLDNGGSKMAREIGWERSAIFDNPRGFVDALRAALGPERLALLGRMRTALRSGPVLFVHAGLHPQRPMNEYLRRDWRTLPKGEGAEDESPLWVRAPFLNWTAPFEDGVYVVHGHTITERGPDLRANRVGLDTGAYRTGRLTAIEMRGDQMRFITAVTADARPIAA